MSGSFKDAFAALKHIFEGEVGVLDKSGKVIFCNYDFVVGQIRIGVVEKIRRELVASVDNYTYQRFKVLSSEFFVFCQGTDRLSYFICKMLVECLKGLESGVFQKIDKNAFIQDILLDKLSDLDCIVTAQESKILFQMWRVIFLIEFKEPTTEENLAKIPHKNNYVFSMSEKQIAIVNEFIEFPEFSEIQNGARKILRNFSKDSQVEFKIGVSEPTENLSKLKMAYEQCLVSLEIGKIEDAQQVLYHKKLGVVKLVCEIPKTIRQSYLSKMGIERLEFDDEIATTVAELYRNNLNLSLTARKMFIHRNTLIYRINRIKKEIGLDLRDFGDAVAFKIALLVDRSLKIR